MALLQSTGHWLNSEFEIRKMDLGHLDSQKVHKQLIKDFIFWGEKDCNLIRNLSFCSPNYISHGGGGYQRTFPLRKSSSGGGRSNATSETTIEDHHDLNHQQPQNYYESGRNWKSSSDRLSSSRQDTAFATPTRTRRGHRTETGWYY